MSKFVQIDGMEISFLKHLIEKKSMAFYYFALCEIKGCDFDEITNHIITNQIDIKHGDVIVFEDPCKLYRNAGRCIWSNGRAISLSHDYDEYGEVPSCFEISPNLPFHPRYWRDTIHHNINYWPCDEYRTQCCNNISVSEKNIRYTWFVHNEHKEYVIFDTACACELSEDEFKKVLLDKSKPYEAYCMIDYVLDDMEHMNTSVVHGFSENADTGMKIYQPATTTENEPSE